MSLKMEFVTRATKPHARMSALCREYGISRQTGYKWLSRYKREGFDGLEEQSRRPKSSPLATAEDVVVAILKLREAHPRRGPKKLRPQLQRILGNATPSTATIARVIKRMGLVRQRSKFRRLSIVDHAPAITANGCNEVWTVDFKGWWRTGDGQRCEPLTVRDAYSRYVLCAKALPSPSLEAVRKIFVELFKRYGVPTHIQVDNGNPFISVQSRGGLTRLSAWWTALGIVVVRSRPGCPQDNGGHERMHRDIREEVQAYPSKSRRSEQRALNRWRQDFNQVRPHEALGGKTPGDLYKRSIRRPVQTRYLYPPGWGVRTVVRGGRVHFNGAEMTVGAALVNYRVGLEPLDASTYRLWFRHLDLGTLDIGPPNRDIDITCQAFLDRRRKVA